MATREELYTALRNADKAGDAAGARRLAAYIQSLPADAPQTAAPKAEERPVSDSVNAFTTGGTRGFARLLGMPIDAAANVLDIGRAALGTPWLLAGKVPPEALQIPDRSQMLGSGENIIAVTRKLGGGAAVDPVNPKYEGGYMQALGGAMAGPTNPNQLAMSVAGTMAGKATHDATGNNALAIAAGMGPAAARQAIAEGTKYMVRGGEEGRQNMLQRVADLKAAGVESPTLGLASGNQVLGATENLLQSTPGAIGIMKRNRDAALAGIEGATAKAADLASTNRGAMESGRGIQAGAKAFKEDFKTQQQALYNKLDEFIAGQSPVDVKNTKGTLAALNADIPGAPELSKQFKNGRIQAIEQAVNSDLTRDTTYTPSQLRAALATSPQRLQDLNAALGEGRLPFEAVKKTRTLVGNEIADNSLLSDVPRSKWNPLYGALSEDMGNAAAAAGPNAVNAFDRANAFTRAGLGRMERIAPVIDRPAPEQSFTALSSTLKENTSTFQAVKKSLPQDVRGDFAGTIIERLGKATPGQQDATGGKWSPETFLTNWSKIKPEAQAELLSGIPNATEVKGLVDSVAQAASMMRDNSKMWANPSGTAAAATARGILGTVGAGGLGAAAGMVSPMVPIGAGIGLGGINLTARALTSNKIRDAMMGRTEIDPETQNAIVRMLISSGRLDQQAGQ